MWGDSGPAVGQKWLFCRERKALAITQLPYICIAAIIHHSHVNARFMLGSAGHAGDFDPAAAFGLDCAGPLLPTRS